MKKSLIRFTAVALGLFSAFAGAAGEVSLLKTQTTFVYSRQADYAGRFEALVANLGPVKQVAIHIKKKDGSWVDVPLSYDRPADAGREVWVRSYYGAPSDADEFEFAVKYQVNGQTYWDNNNGANYRIGKIAGTYLNGVNVYSHPVAPSVFTNGSYNGAVTLKNLGFAKQVQVRYTTDNWATVKTANATFDPNYWSPVAIANPNAYGFEEWRYALDVGPTANQVQFAVSYTVNGQTYWDNNFGRNYVSTLLR